MIEWLNLNKGFVFAILTSVYVIATIIIAIIMIRSNQLTNKLEKRRSSPFVIFDIVIENQFVHAELRNIGLTEAFDVKVVLEPKLTYVGDTSREISIACNTINVIAPQRTFSEFVDSSPNFFERYEDAQFNAYVNYKDIDGFEYNRTYHFDLNFHKNLTYIFKKDIGKELEKMNTNIENLLKLVRNKLST